MIQFPKYRRSHAAMKRLYNRIYRFYGSIEKSLGPKLDTVVQEKIAYIPDASQSTVLEYCCGSGLLSLKLAPHFRSVNAKDLSINMLARAKERARNARMTTISFYEGDILNIDDRLKSYDYAFVSFALHLFPPEKEKDILRQLCTIARKAVFIIDHNRKWRFGTAILEWLEGSYYDKFIKMDFNEIWPQIGCTSFNESEIDDCLVLSFYCE